MSLLPIAFVVGLQTSISVVVLCIVYGTKGADSRADLLKAAIILLFAGEIVLVGTLLVNRDAWHTGWLYLAILEMFATHVIGWIVAGSIKDEEAKKKTATPIAGEAVKFLAIGGN